MQIQNYKQTKFADIPIQWCEDEFSQHISFLTGWSFKSSDYTNQGIQLLRQGNLNDRKLKLNNEPVFLPVHFKEKYKKYLLQSGDIVISLTGTTGKKDYGFAVKIPHDAPELLLNQRIAKLILLSNINNDYLSYVMSSDYFQKQFYRLEAGTKQSNMSTLKIKKIKILVPPLKEQQRIASILSNVDNLIQKTDQVIEQTQRLKKALMQRLLTKGIGHTKLKQTELGEIPEEWQIVRFRQIVKSYKNGIYKLEKYYGSGYPSIRMYNIKDGKVNSIKAPLLNVTEQELNDYRLLENDLLVNRVNSLELVGKTGIVKSDLGEATFESKNIRVRLKTEVSDPDFVNYFFNSILYFNQLKLSIKAAIGQSTINQDDLNNLILPLPKLQEQQKIAFIISNVDTLIQKLKDKKKSEEILKKGLMQQLLTGKIRVKV